MKWSKPVRLFFSLLLVVPLFPASPIFAETVQDVPVGEPTISSKAEDPLKEYREQAKNQAKTVESNVVQDVPGVEKKVEPSPTKIEDAGESPTPENGGGEASADTPNTKRPTPRGGGGISPHTITLIEGDPDVDDPSTYHIDKDFAELLRTDYTVQDQDVSWSGYGKSANTLTSDDMESLKNLAVNQRNLRDLKGIEYATNLEILNCSANNQLTSLNLNSNTALKRLYCDNNTQMTQLDVSNCSALTTLSCSRSKIGQLNISNSPDLTSLQCVHNPLGDLDVSNNPALKELICYGTQLSELDISHNPALEILKCMYNSLDDLDVSNNPVLKELMCYSNQLSELDVSNNPELKILHCNDNLLVDTLDMSNNPVLVELMCYNNQLDGLILSSSNSVLKNLYCSNNLLSELDVSNNSALTELACDNNLLGELDVSNNSALMVLNCNNNLLRELDVSNNSALTRLNCNNNLLRELDVSNNPALTILYCAENQLGELDVSNNLSLRSLDCNNNQIANITKMMGLTNLSSFSVQNQNIAIPVPTVSNDGKAIVKVLQTTGKTGLSGSNGSVYPQPIFEYNGDDILLSNVTRESLSDKAINFSYSGSQLVEGAVSGSKSFSGVITFYTVSDLGSELKSNKKKINTGNEVEWTWTISCLTSKKAENIRATLATLPSGLVLSPATFVIDKNGSKTTTNDINNTNLGDLNEGETIKITFKTIANGDAEEWLETDARLDWEDDTISSPHYNESKGAVQILDEEQQDLPKDSDDMGILSAPVRFYFGSQSIFSTIQTYQLNAQNYQTNTSVVTDGFYTRIKDDQSISTGWKLTASLSEFTDSVGRPMPNGAGTSLRLENMFIQKVNNRDTPQEALDPAATGGPSTVQTDETLVAGQTAKTLVSAQAGEGQGTWQLQMPFDDISLTLPAGAGKSNTDYKAKLTWTLQDTP